MRRPASTPSRVRQSSWLCRCRAGGDYVASPQHDCCEHTGSTYPKGPIMADKGQRAALCSWLDVFSSNALVLRQRAFDLKRYLRVLLALSPSTCRPDSSSPPLSPFLKVRRPLLSPLAVSGRGAFLLPSTGSLTARTLCADLCSPLQLKAVHPRAESLLLPPGFNTPRAMREQPPSCARRRLQGT